MADGLLRRLLPGAFPRSLWVFHANTGGCNGCDIEVLDALTPRYDVERLGMRLVGSPRPADVLLVCGPVTRPMLAPLRRLYEAVPDPKIVVAIGACAVGGGPWFDTYNVVGGVAWVTGFLLAGYWFGNQPWVKKNFSVVILAIIFLSVLPMVIEYFRHVQAARRQKSPAGREGPPEVSQLGAAPAPQVRRPGDGDRAPGDAADV